ncbi:MAG: hypothetical protein CME66_03950 [Halobacteriovoraceae bacterium]|nr:hypothetical protein [Halobacteriovoraceae bacterium]
MKCKAFCSRLKNKFFKVNFCYKLCYKKAQMKLFIFLAIFIVLIPIGVCSSEKKTLQAGIAREDYPPFYFKKNSDGQLTGFSIELCNLLAKKLNYNIEYKRFPFARVLHYLYRGKLDLSCTMFNTSERSKGIIFTSVPHAFEKIYAISTSKTILKNDFKKIKHKNIQLAGIRGYYYGDFIKGLNLHLVANEKQLLKTLISKRADIIFSNKKTILAISKKLGNSQKLFFSQRPVYNGPNYLGFSRKTEHSKSLASQFTKELVKLSKTEAYKKLLEKYHLNPPQY